MSVVVYGKRLCGQVDHVPGLFYTSTLFWHVDYLPLFPLRSYIVLEGSEHGENFRGKPFPLQLKSVLAGYLRGWLAATAVLTGGVGVAATMGFYVGVENGGIIALLAALAAMAGALWFIFSTRTWWFLPVQLALLLGSAAVYYDVRTQVPNAVRIPGAAPGTLERRWHDASYIDTLLVANAAALLYTLARLLTPASSRRALELGRLLDLPPEQVMARLGLDPAALGEPSPGEEGIEDAEPIRRHVPKGRAGEDTLRTPATVEEEIVLAEWGEEAPAEGIQQRPDSRKASREWPQGRARRPAAPAPSVETSGFRVVWWVVGGLAACFFCCAMPAGGLLVWWLWPTPSPQPTTAGRFAAGRPVFEANNPPPVQKKQWKDPNQKPPRAPTVAPRPSNMPKGEELTKLLADLKSADEAARQRAVSILQQTQALKGMDAKAAETAVLPLLSDSNVFIRCAAIKILAEMGGRDSVAPLEKLAKENDFFHSGLARQALASIKKRSDRTASLPTSQGPSSVVKTPGLLAYWSFEEGEGGKAADASGYGLHATLVNAGWSEGIRGKALRLTGKGSYLDFGDSPRLSFAARAPFTIAFWTRTTRARGTLLSLRNSREGGAIINILIDGGKAKAQVRQDGNDVFGPTEVHSGTINDGNWHHVALTREGDSIELFLDGVSQGRKSGNLSGGAITTNLRALGAERYWLSHFAFADPHFEGDMDEFCIFDRLLKANEIAALALR